MASTRETSGKDFRKKYQVKRQGRQGILERKTGVDIIPSNRKHHWSGQEARDFRDMDWQDKPEAQGAMTIPRELLGVDFNDGNIFKL